MTGGRTTAVEGVFVQQRFIGRCATIPRPVEFFDAPLSKRHISISKLEFSVIPGSLLARITLSLAQLAAWRGAVDGDAACR